eukprot:363516-Chlamydomonas_euryale.AAC.9
MHACMHPCEHPCMLSCTCAWQVVRVCGFCALSPVSLPCSPSSQALSAASTHANRDEEMAEAGSGDGEAGPSGEAYVDPADEAAKADMEHKKR